jgi:hypothetical protein
MISINHVINFCNNFRVGELEAQMSAKDGEIQWRSDRIGQLESELGSVHGQLNDVTNRFVTYVCQIN